MNNGILKRLPWGLLAGLLFLSATPAWALTAIEVAKLMASDGAAGDYFSSSVALAGETAVIGAGEDDDKGTLSGSAYVFIRSGTTWTQQAKLLAGDGAEGDYFGSSVALAGETAVIGARWDADNGEWSGSAYVFTRSGTTWTQRAKLLAGDGAEGDYFGSSVALAGNTAVIGAWGDDENGTDSGSTYVFDLIRTAWRHVASACAVDEKSLNKYRTMGPELGFESGKFGSIQAQCNITNPLDDNQNPGWNRLIVSFRDPYGFQKGNRIRVTLYRVSVSAAEPPGTVSQVAVLDSTTNRATGSGVANVAVSFSHDFDFFRNAYFITIEMSRGIGSSTGPSVVQVALY